MATRLVCSQTGEVGEYRAADGDTFGVFVFAGYEPETNLLRGIAELNEQGYVVTDRSQQTSVPGVYAAGDVCVKSLRQVAASRPAFPVYMLPVTCASSRCVRS